MGDLTFVAGEFPRLASVAREAAEAVLSARPEGGAGAFASAMPGTSLSSKMQGVEDKFADKATKTGTSLDEHADSLEAAERDFIAAEEENGQLIGSIIEGNSYGPGAGSGSPSGGVLTGHSYGSTSDDGGWRNVKPIVGGPMLPPDFNDPVYDPVKKAADGIVRGAKEVVEGAARGAQQVAEGLREAAENLDPRVAGGPMVKDPAPWLHGMSGSGDK